MSDDGSSDELLRRRIVEDHSMRYPTHRFRKREVSFELSLVIQSFILFLASCWATHWAYTSDYMHSYPQGIVAEFVLFAKVLLQLALYPLGPTGILFGVVGLLVGAGLVSRPSLFIFK